MFRIDETTPSYTDPIELLHSCHQRILQFCTLLERMESHRQRKGVDEELQQAAGRVLRYFSISGPAHHRDEEEFLLPWLQDQPKLPREIAHILMDQLPSEHRRLETSWTELAKALAEIHQGETRSSPIPAAVFVGLQRQHVALENEKIFPLARRLLAPHTAENLGRRMFQARQAQFAQKEKA